MYNTGKTIRLKRILKNGKAVIYAPVHNMTSPDSFQGQVDVTESIQASVLGGATAQVISKGFLRMAAHAWEPQIGILNYLCTYAALSPKPARQVLVSSVEESAMLGADGVCFFVGMGSEDDAEVIGWLGRVGCECEKHGLVFVCEAEFPNFYHPIEENRKRHGLRYLKFVGRLCAELGSDLISANWPGSAEAFEELVDHVKVPVLLNGGPKMPQREFLQMVEGSVRAGGSGVLVGRNFSEAASTEKTVRAASKIILEGTPFEQAFQEMGP